MLKQIHTVSCTHVIAQVSLGFYDADGNLVGEETFPQGDTGPLVAKLFHPHSQELASLIATCVEQAWQKLRASGQAGEPESHEERQGNSRGERTAGPAR